MNPDTEPILPCGCRVPFAMCDEAMRLLIAEEDAAQAMRNAYGAAFVPARDAWREAMAAYNAHVGVEQK
jgi:hypothetical protein